MECSNYQLVIQLQTRKPKNPHAHIHAHQAKIQGFFLYIITPSNKVQRHLYPFNYQFDTVVCHRWSTTTREHQRHELACNQQSVCLSKSKLCNIFETVSWLSVSSSQPSRTTLSCKTMAVLFGIQEALQITQFEGWLPNSFTVYRTFYPFYELIYNTVCKILNKDKIQKACMFAEWMFLVLQVKLSKLFKSMQGVRDLPPFANATHLGEEMKSKKYTLFPGRVSFGNKVRCLNILHQISLMASRWILNHVQSFWQL